MIVARYPVWRLSFESHEDDKQALFHSAIILETKKGGDLVMVQAEHNDGIPLPAKIDQDFLLKHFPGAQIVDGQLIMPAELPAPAATKKRDGEVFLFNNPSNIIYPGDTVFPT